MSEGVSCSGVPDPIEWVIRTVLREEFGVSGDITFDQPLCSIIEFFVEVEYLCEKLHGVFSLKDGGRQLEHEFTAIVQSTNGACTLADLAQFIEDNYEVVRMKRTTILGRPCAAAGAFFAIKRLVNGIAPDCESFAPSTIVKRRFRGRRLRELLKRVFLLTCGRADLSGRVRKNDTIASVLTLMSIPPVLVVIFLITLQIPAERNPLFFGLLSSVCLMFGTSLICLGLQEFYRYALDELIGVLPSRSYTFRDLAQDIVKSSTER
jgi:hypothetical protein